MKKDVKLLHEKFCIEAEIMNRSKKTIYWYRDVIKRFLNYSNIKYLEEITTETLKDYLYHGKTTFNWSASTYINYRKGLKSFFTWCVVNKYLEENPVDPIPKPKIDKSLPKSLSKQQALQLLDCSYHTKYTFKHERYRNRAIVGMMLYTGIRRQELLNLKAQEIDLENNAIFINKGKGNKDRVVPLNTDLKYILNEYIQDRNRLKKSSIYFFTGIQRDGQLSVKGLTEALRKIKKRSKLEFSAHKLRHTFATLMLEGGCDLFSLSKMMGHADIKTTTVYLNATVEHLQGEIGKHPLSMV